MVVSIPAIGRFMSADPYIRAPDNLQSYNRYSYVLNNPLMFTDPSGYFSLKKLIRGVVAIAVAVYAP
ncbi:RHS repeat domain-containing protein [Herminiimonas glaciei]|uniref:RHS repeat domain-containing protein n=1 Tax=Herminiimonas glaciei TaxID=523788 RepID=A0ABW2I6F5_9BURK